MDSLENKYTAKGVNREEAISYLRKIGLPEQVAESPVVWLAENIRSLLIQPFASYQKQNSGMEGVIGLHDSRRL